MKRVNYNPWPLGGVPKELQRPELDELRRMGYEFDDAREAVNMFEQKVASFWGSKYAVTVDCCSNGLFLCLKYLNMEGTVVIVPKHTYVSVPMQVLHAGYKVRFKDFKWSGAYQLSPLPLWDAAVRWEKGAYIPETLMVLSFQIKKTIPIGRGGIILTDDVDAYTKLKFMSYDGRDLSLPYDHPDHVKCLGYHMYMTPEDAARGLILMSKIDKEGDTGGSDNYPDVSQMLKGIV
jgi:dTDP-4-amino-4,6-dideoxygalactose transaminase